MSSPDGKVRERLEAQLAEIKCAADREYDKRPGSPVPADSPPRWLLFVRSPGRAHDFQRGAS